MTCGNGKNGKIDIIKNLYWNSCKLKVLLSLEQITRFIGISRQAFIILDSHLEQINFEYGVSNVMNTDQDLNTLAKQIIFGTSSLHACKIFMWTNK